ncbi:MAG: rhomboid family intramembrane serine protease [Bacteroidota bacterium]
MQRITPVVLNLIIINVLVYLVQNFFTAFNITDWGSLHYFKSSDFKPHQLITHMFMHDTGGPGHIFFNMFSLFMFGTMLENYIGSKRFLIFYLICGLGAGLLTQLTIPYSADMFAKSVQGLSLASEHSISMAEVVHVYKQEYSMIGASGAIMGVMAAFAYLFPNTEMFIMFIPIPVKAKYVIPVFVLIDLFGGINPSVGDNVGHFAHLGGAIVGFVLIYYWNKTNRKTFY